MPSGQKRGRGGGGIKFFPGRLTSILESEFSSDKQSETHSLLAGFSPPQLRIQVGCAESVSAGWHTTIQCQICGPKGKHWNNWEQQGITRPNLTDLEK